jgi:DNA polymerase (family 10)
VSKVLKRGSLVRTFALSKALATMVEEYVERGETTARKELESQVPATVLELCEIPKIGGKTARTLFQDFGIDSLASLENALDAGKLDNVKGIGSKTKDTMRSHIEAAKA